MQLLCQEVTSECILAYLVFFMAYAYLFESKVKLKVCIDIIELTAPVV